jgi:dihydropteroate synthase
MKLFCGSKELDISTPVVMGILNLTPDSFFDGGQFVTPDSQLHRVEQMVKEGAAIVDAGAVSTRPGAAEVSEYQELERLIPAVRVIANHFHGLILSVDTFRPAVARAAIENGAVMINDIYGGRFAEGMLETVATLKVPYIMMHMKGDPSNMQHEPTYRDVVAEVQYFFENQLVKCRAAGIGQVILDPGFGFGKTIAHNYALLSRFVEFKSLGCPILAGISRKSMITGHLAIHASGALNGTTVLNTIALMKGADILRVHDVKEAVEAVRLVGMLDREIS